ncbi:acyl-CoA dehydrogenase family protein [Nocardioides litoris]|uniref:acyl-CoA dehydrogenase family protein n=1 Tax=Nocardioides litoris TaxID=1926648 RepID=UPI001476CC52|nr:acyl-CoA dehydrogenase family protein [Nocardioides litoris]
MTDRTEPGPGRSKPFREQVVAFLDSHLPPDWQGVGGLSPADYAAFRLAWRALLTEHRLIAPAWPREYGGGGHTPAESAVVAEEFARVGVPRGGTNDPFSIQMIGNTILAVGTEAQRERFLPGIIDGTYVFCQGFSEPDHGSDLSRVSTRARRDGDEWVIDGQKIWTSNALTANWIFVLCRTGEEDTSRYDGLTLLLVPLDQPGVERRPITMMNGAAEFCETFFSGARTQVGLEVGGVGGGWRAATGLLTFERGETTATLPVRFGVELDRLRRLIDSRRGFDDPAVRDDFARCWTRVELMRLSGLNNLSRWSEGQPIGPESSLEKLLWSELHGTITALACRVLGDEATTYAGPDPASYFLCDEPGMPPGSVSSWVKVHLSTLGETIAAGTSEIQRNIIAERLLGLPR